mgnify:CR=1 FL=1
MKAQDIGFPIESCLVVKYESAINMIMMAFPYADRNEARKILFTQTSYPLGYLSDDKHISEYELHCQLLKLLRKECL